ncbi:DUF1501 domain-containing protein [Dyadobacter psychrotolerans]|uniref:DUF1501 domain-containing protein n=1 Tax=Dyadobacter psychrotolerans TaxID=2541721 RepID=A0A4R5DE31_9BACT|nr:DUF1501 domain-containing protein [Dyadobacter psychrotolerans]TDE08553.1 DUF1501 domain-containing protein [Dyadobacter psychrotolerans]
MQRRDFLAAASTMLLPVVLDGFRIKSYGKDSPLVKSIMKTAALNNDKILVVIYLNGGNDGLNTVIPLEYYSKYNALRTNIAIPEAQVLRLSGNLETGLHPAMTGMRDMYNEGKLGIIHSVSYPNPSLSHYRSSEILMTAVDSNQYAQTGWAGRYLENEFPNITTTEMLDPLAIQIGYTNSTALLGSQQPLGVAIPNVDSFYRLTGEAGSISSGDQQCCDPGDMIEHFRQQQIMSVAYATEIKRAAAAGHNQVTYPTASSTNELSEQLKVVARLIHGGLKTKIYYLEMLGYDTHAGQVGTNNTEGIHANLLKKLSDSIAIFQKDLKAQGTENKVVGMTFSDFGRRATSNASKGTDHGIAAPMFVFGTGIKRQVVGTNPDLVNDLVPLVAPAHDSNQDIKMQIDFRRVYNDIINDWFGVTKTTTDSILFRNFNTISLFSDVVETVKSGSWPDREVWSSNRVPGPNEYVKVNYGHNIQIAQDITVKNIQVDGELTFLGSFGVNTTG